jgi:hypothetical protein
MRTAHLIPVLVGFLASCGGDDTPTNRRPPDAGTGDGGELEDDGGDNPTPTGGCPSSEPKVGDSCGPGITESDSCEFQVGTCVANGVTYNETVVYCCPNGSWGTCGGRSPCDGIVPEVDAAPPDAPRSAGDGGLDANGDAGLDGSADGVTD